jgi:hypothetical protein
MLMAEALLEENGPAVLRKLIDASLGGDLVTARFLVGRLCPANIDQPITLDVAPGQERDLLAVHAAAVRAMCDGEITPKEALAVAHVLAVGAKLIQLKRPAKQEERMPSVPRARGEEGRGTPRHDRKSEAGQPASSTRPSGLVPVQEVPVSDLYSGDSTGRERRVCRRGAGEESGPLSSLYLAAPIIRAPLSDLYSSTCLRRSDAPAKLPRAA